VLFIGDGDIHIKTEVLQGERLKKIKIK
jgi:hypothetical protein